MKISKNKPFSSGECDTTSGLFLSARQVGWIISATLFFCFFVFIAGYFLGKKKAAEKFYNKLKEDSFADHVYYSMCSLYDKEGQELNVESVASQEDTVLSDEDVQSQVALDAEPQIESQSVCLENQENDGQDNQYYAELIGFGTHKAARKFADRLLSNNISVAVKKRRSKTAKGKVITWYQVVTESFSCKGDLMALVDDVSSQERLKDVRIVST